MRCQLLGNLRSVRQVDESQKFPVKSVWPIHDACEAFAAVEWAMNMKVGQRERLGTEPTDFAIRLVAGVFSFAVAGAALFQALVETDGGAGEIEFGAQLVFEEALVAEVEGL